MTYASQTDLQERFGLPELLHLTDEANSGSVDSVQVNRALEDADAEINGWLAARYSLPLASPPALLKRLACDMARYHLYSDRVTDAVRQRYEDAGKLLKALSLGQVQLGDSATLPVAPAISGIGISAPARVFASDTLADY